MVFKIYQKYLIKEFILIVCKITFVFLILGLIMGLLEEINFFSDEDHKIEHTIEEFKKELNSCDFDISYMSTIWGEIWAECISKI